MKNEKQTQTTNRTLSFELYDDGHIETDIRNMSPEYVPVICARAIQQIAHTPALMGTDKSDFFEEWQQRALNVINRILENKEKRIKNQKAEWIPVEESPPTLGGAFLCIDSKNPDTIYSDMYWDPQVKMFGTKEGIGYKFITHYIPSPILRD